MDLGPCLTIHYFGQVGSYNWHPQCGEFRGSSSLLVSYVCSFGMCVYIVAFHSGTYISRSRSEEGKLASMRTMPSCCISNHHFFLCYTQRVDIMWLCGSSLKVSSEFCCCRVTSDIRSLIDVYIYIPVYESL